MSVSLTQDLSRNFEDIETARNQVLELWSPDNPSVDRIKVLSQYLGTNIIDLPAFNPLFLVGATGASIHEKMHSPCMKVVTCSAIKEYPEEENVEKKRQQQAVTLTMVFLKTKTHLYTFHVGSTTLDITQIETGEQGKDKKLLTDPGLDHPIMEESRKIRNHRPNSAFEIQAMIDGGIDLPPVLLGIVAEYLNDYFEMAKIKHSARQIFSTHFSARVETSKFEHRLIWLEREKSNRLKCGKKGKTTEEISHICDMGRRELEKVKVSLNENDPEKINYSARPSFGVFPSSVASITHPKGEQDNLLKQVFAKNNEGSLIAIDLILQYVSDL